jgi:type III pantothenate kinase
VKEEITLLVNIGNTNTEFASLSSLDTKLKHYTKIKTSSIKRTLLVKIFRKEKIGSVVVASVVPVKTKLFKTVSAEYKKKFYEVKTSDIIGMGLKIKYKNVKALGIDRALNVYAAKEKNCYNPPVIVVDAGTATTIDCINRKYEFIGGTILPGIEMMLSSLHHNTAKLPLVKFNKGSVQNPIGKDTKECILSGVKYGYVGMVEKLLLLYMKKLKYRRNNTIIFTGGAAKYILPSLKNKIKNISYMPQLTLEGLKLLWCKLQKSTVKT